MLAITDEGMAFIVITDTYHTEMEYRQTSKVICTTIHTYMTLNII